MRLTAIATAAGVPDGGFAGTVEHLYPRVCLLGLADLRRDGRSSGLQRAAGSTIRDLAAATGDFAAGAASEIVAALLGLGEGTTPVGDDFLVVYVAGLLSGVAIIEARARLELTLCEELKAAASRTHRVSRLYLQAAAEGQISERLYALATCIATGAGEGTVTFTAEAALNVGHSSGACGILGLLIGCTAWEE